MLKFLFKFFLCEFSILDFLIFFFGKLQLIKTEKTETENRGSDENRNRKPGYPKPVKPKTGGTGFKLVANNPGFICQNSLRNFIFFRLKRKNLPIPSSNYSLTISHHPFSTTTVTHVHRK